MKLRIRDLREDNDLKQKDVADFLQISRTTYNHYELGHTSFTADMIISLAKLFHTTPNVLLNFDTSFEITDTDLLKLCKFVKEENDELLEISFGLKNLIENDFIISLSTNRLGSIDIYNVDRFSITNIGYLLLEYL